jgi:hypothetical protein
MDKRCQKRLMGSAALKTEELEKFAKQEQPDSGSAPHKFTI